MTYLCQLATYFNVDDSIIMSTYRGNYLTCDFISHKKLHVDEKKSHVNIIYLTCRGRRSVCWLLDIFAEFPHKRTSNRLCCVLNLNMAKCHIPTKYFVPILVEVGAVVHDIFQAFSFSYFVPFCCWQLPSSYLRWTKCIIFWIFDLSFLTILSGLVFF